MSLNIKEISEAWIIAAKPNQQQKKLAQLRYEICLQCPFFNTILNIEVCGKCGCPISKKVFTNKYDSCPEHKWKEIEFDFFELPERKRDDKDKKVL